MNQNQPIEKIKILFLASNPRDTERLALDQEYREIYLKIRSSEYRDALDLKQSWAVSFDDLVDALLSHKPHIVHFSGHGTSTGEIILLNKNDQAKAVKPEIIKNLFSTLKDNIRVVLLNACYSKIQAEAIQEVIDCVIGMNTGIGDEAARIFSTSFYGAIGYGRSVKTAFNLAKVVLEGEGISAEDTPELLNRKEVDPKEVILIYNFSNSGINNPNENIKIVDYPEIEPEPEPKIQLKSEVGVDYSKLKELLSQGKWKEADQETHQVMLKVANQEIRGYLDDGDIKMFPCADLRTIDQLWVKYSKAKFGFSIQREIYLSCGAQLDEKYPGDRIWYEFSEQIGWRENGKFINYDEITFDASTPKGCLPCMEWFQLTNPILGIVDIGVRSLYKLALGQADVTARVSLFRFLWARNEFKTEVGVDYSRLEELLSQGKWKEADEETARVMLKAAKREEGGWLDVDSIDKFPCADLRTIDQLWVKYSNGKFGFSVQKNIYLDCGAKLNGYYPGNEIWYEFCDKIGWVWKNKWISYSGLTFNTSAPQGHLPTTIAYNFWDKMANFMVVFPTGTESRGIGGRLSLEDFVHFDIFSRVETCNLCCLTESQPLCSPTPSQSEPKTRIPSIVEVTNKLSEEIGKKMSRDLSPSQSEPKTRIPSIAEVTNKLSEEIGKKISRDL